MDKMQQPIRVKKGWSLLGMLPNFLYANISDFLKNVIFEKGETSS